MLMTVSSHISKKSGTKAFWLFKTVFIAFEITFWLVSIVINKENGFYEGQAPL